MVATFFVVLFSHDAMGEILKTGGTVLLSFLPNNFKHCS
jgi:hypothetical protein